MSQERRLTRKSPDGKSQVIAVSHEFRFGSTVAVKLVEMVATLEIVNSDGSKSRAVKNIKDGTSNALNTESFNIQIPDRPSRATSSLRSRASSASATRRI